MTIVVKMSCFLHVCILHRISLVFLYIELCGAVHISCFNCPIPRLLRNTLLDLFVCVCVTMCVDKLSFCFSLQISGSINVCLCVLTYSVTHTLNKRTHTLTHSRAHSLVSPEVILHVLHDVRGGHDVP